jgi:hypothetical protein
MGLYDTMKDAIGIAQKVDNIELYRALLDLQKGASELSDENKKLKEEVDRLTNIINDNNNKELRGDCYYFNGEGPYCTKCHDDENKKIHMNKNDNNLGTIYYMCPKCKHNVVAENYEYNLQTETQQINHYL